MNNLNVGLVNFGLQFNLASNVVLIKMFKPILCRLMILFIILMV